MGKVRKESIVEVIALILAVAVVFGAGLGLDHVFPNEDLLALRVVSYEASEVCGMKLTGADVEADLSRENGTWAVVGDDSYQLDRFTVEKTIESVCSLTASRKLEEPLGAGEYGFDAPLYTVELRTETGAAETVEIGDYHTGLGKFYVRALGGEIYLVDAASVTPILRNPLDYAEGTSIGLFGLDTISRISVESAEQTFELLPYDDFSNDLYSTAFDWKIETADAAPKGADTNTMYQFTYLLKHISELERADYLSDGADYSRYGLDAPFMTVTADHEAVSYEGQRYMDTLVVTLGEVDGTVYAKYDGDPVVYRLTEEVASPLKQLTTSERFLSTKICAVDPAEVTGLQITYGSKRYNVEISREAAADGTVETYYVNGELVDGMAVQDILTVITEISCYGLAKDAELTPALEIVVQRNVPGFERMPMVFSKYSVDFYNVSFGGIDNYLINKNYVSVLETLLKEL